MFRQTIRTLTRSAGTVLRRRGSGSLAASSTASACHELANCVASPSTPPSPSSPDLDLRRLVARCGLAVELEWVSSRVRVSH